MNGNKGRHTAMAESKSDRDVRWQSPEHVKKWIANNLPEVERVPIRKKLVSFLPFESKAEIRVLDLGTGTGLLSLEVLNRFPNARLICQDFSDGMLDTARENLSEFAVRVFFVKSDLRTPEWRQAIDGTFDAVIAGFALHSIPERIQAICAEICTIIRPDGCFMTCDNVTAPGPVTTMLYREARHEVHWQNAKTVLGVEKAIELLEIERHERESSPSRPVRKQNEVSFTLTEQIDWIKEAGFDEADCLWKDMRRAIIAGFRH
jgi:tRNA (cmo5U34)-methyltransferase